MDASPRSRVVSWSDSQFFPEVRRVSCVTRRQAQPVTLVRYHLGDDARWANLNLDDSSWTVAPDGRVPPPAADTNGFVWSRVRVAVPQNAAEPLAFRWDAASEGGDVEEVFVNGVPVGRTGDFPRHTMIRKVPQTPGDRPSGRSGAAAGTVAEVAIRGWTSSFGRDRRNTQVMDISIRQWGAAALNCGLRHGHRICLGTCHSLRLACCWRCWVSPYWRSGCGRDAKSCFYVRCGS